MHFVPLLDVTQKHPVWSVKLSPVVTGVYIHANARLVIHQGLLIGLLSIFYLVPQDCFGRNHLADCCHQLVHVALVWD